MCAKRRPDQSDLDEDLAALHRIADCGVEVT